MRRRFPCQKQEGLAAGVQTIAREKEIHDPQACWRFWWGFVRLFVFVVFWWGVAGKRLGSLVVEDLESIMIEIFYRKSVIYLVRAIDRRQELLEVV